jgi:hypothetical protein
MEIKFIGDLKIGDCDCFLFGGDSHHFLYSGDFALWRFKNWRL